MSATMTEADPFAGEVHADDSIAYARTIQNGLTPRERRALAAVYENMPCTVSTVARIAGVSRRTVGRACEALEGDHLRLIQRTGAGLLIHPDAIGAVDAWAHRHGNRSGDLDWWEDPGPSPVADIGGYPQDQDREPWPDDVFPEHAFDPLPGGEDIELARRAVESRRVPMGRGVRVPVAVLDYVTETRSLQAAKVATTCARRADRHGMAEFGRGELSRVTGLSAQQVTDALARLRREGLAARATTTRVELDLSRR